MAIPGYQVINVGLPNESAGSDSLYDAFNKTKNNFSQLFTVASPYNTFTGNSGISIAANANAGTVDVLNTGVTSIIAGTNIVINQSNGNVTISATTGGNSGGLSSVGVTSSTLNVTNTPLVVNGNIQVNLPSIANVAGTYTYPTVTVDSFGRVTNIANANSVGTVTSVGMIPGLGIQVSGGPVTTAGNITITNTGVTRLNAGVGIQLSAANGNVTISSTGGSSGVTAVALASNNLVITGSPIISSGTITVNLPANITATRFLSTVATGTAPFEVLSTTKVANLSVETANVATSATTAATVTTGAQPNITSVGTLTSLSVSGNVVAANLAGTIRTAAQPNITSLGTLSSLSVSGIANLGSNANVKITGGVADQVLKTDGLGNLSWGNASTGLPNAISFGNTSVSIPASDGPVDLSVTTGNANSWVSTFGSQNGYDATYSSVAVDSTGNIYAIGFCSGATSNQGFINKLSSSGELLFEYGTGDIPGITEDVYGESIAVDSTGNVYALFTLYPSVGDDSLWVIKLDSSLSTIWSTRVSVTGLFFNGVDIALNSTNQVFIGADRQLVGLDSDGSVLWIKDTYVSETSKSSVVQNVGDGILVCGYGGFGGKSVVYKVDYNGTLLWTNAISSVGGGPDFIAYDGTDWYAVIYEGYIVKVSGADNSTILWEKKLYDIVADLSVANNYVIQYQNGFIYVFGSSTYPLQYPSIGGSPSSITNQYAHIAKLNASDGSLVYLNGLFNTGTGSLYPGYWNYGHRGLVLTNDSIIAAGYGYFSPSSSGEGGWVSKLPLNGSGGNITVGNFSYLNLTLTSSSSANTVPAGTGYNGSPAALSSLTPIANTTIVTSVSPDANLSVWTNTLTNNNTWEFDGTDTSTTNLTLFTGSDINASAVFNNIINVLNVSNDVLGSVTNNILYLIPGTQIYYTQTPTSNWNWSITGSTDLQLNAMMSVGQCIEVKIQVNMGAIPYTLNLVRTDGYAQTVFYQNGSIAMPSANTKSLYTLLITKMGYNNFRILVKLESYS